MFKQKLYAEFQYKPNHKIYVNHLWSIGNYFYMLMHAYINFYYKCILFCVIYPVFSSSYAL